MAAFFPLPSARFVARVLYGALRDSSVELINPGHDLVTNSAPVPNQLPGPPHPPDPTHHGSPGGGGEHTTCKCVLQRMAGIIAYCCVSVDTCWAGLWRS